MVRARVAPSAPSRAPASRRRSQATTRTRRAPTNGPGHPRLLLYIPAFLLLSSAPAPHTPPPAAKKHSTHDRPLPPPPQHTTMHAHPAHTNTRQPSPHRPAQHTQHRNAEQQNCPIAASPHHTPRGDRRYDSGNGGNCCCCCCDCCCSPSCMGHAHTMSCSCCYACNAMQRRAVPCTMPHAMPCHATPCSAMICHKVPGYAMICHDMPHCLPRMGGSRPCESNPVSGGASLHAAQARKQME